MKLLLDANISWRLVKLLPDFCEEMLHVENSGLEIPAKDQDIWDYAKQNNFIIVTNDDDFWNLLSQHGFPPKIILFRTGNQSTKEIANSLEKHKNQIKELVDKDHLGILEIV